MEFGVGSRELAAKSCSCREESSLQLAVWSLRLGVCFAGELSELNKPDCRGKRGYQQ